MNFSKSLVNLAIVEILKPTDFKYEIDLCTHIVGGLRKIPFVAEDLKYHGERE